MEAWVLSLVWYFTGRWVAAATLWGLAAWQWARWRGDGAGHSRRRLASAALLAVAGLVAAGSACRVIWQAGAMVPQPERLAAVVVEPEPGEEARRVEAHKALSEAMAALRAAEPMWTAYGGFRGGGTLRLVFADNPREPVVLRYRWRAHRHRMAEVEQALFVLTPPELGGVVWRCEALAHWLQRHEPKAKRTPRADAGGRDGG